VRYSETCAQYRSEFVVPHGRVFNGHQVVVYVVLLEFMSICVYKSAVMYIFYQIWQFIVFSSALWNAIKLSDGEMCTAIG
jgi:hypothetical protein